MLRSNMNQLYALFYHYTKNVENDFLIANGSNDTMQVTRTMFDGYINTLKEL